MRVVLQVLFTELQVKLLKEVAEIHLSYLERDLDNVGDLSFFGLQGNQDEIERTVLDRLAYSREDESSDPEFDEPFEQLVADLTEKSDSKDSEVKRLLIYELDSFVVGCAQIPGPLEDYDPKPRVEWKVGFDERCFRDMIEEIDRRLDSRLLERSLVKVRANGFEFESSFTADESVGYSSSHNQFVLTCPDGFKLDRDKDAIQRAFNRLSVVIKLIYGFGLKLGELRIVLRTESGYHEVKLGRVDEGGWLRRTDGKMDPTLLVRLWPVLRERMKIVEKSLDPLLLRIRELEVTRDADDHIIDLMTCFEMLFSDSVEIRFRLASRIAAFLGLVGISGSYPLMLHAYKDRSELVHGSKTPTKRELDRMQEMIPLIHTYLRATVLARLFCQEDKQSFLARVDLAVQQLIDPASITEADRATLANFRENLAKFERIDSLSPTILS